MQLPEWAASILTSAQLVRANRSPSGKKSTHGGLLTLKTHHLIYSILVFSTLILFISPTFSDPHIHADGVQQESMATSDTATTKTLITPYKREDTDNVMPKAVGGAIVVLLIIIVVLVTAMVFRKS